MLSRWRVVSQSIYLDNLSRVVENKKVDKSQEKYKGRTVSPENIWREALAPSSHQRMGNLMLERGAICDGGAPQ